MHNNPASCRGAVLNGNPLSTELRLTNSDPPKENMRISNTRLNTRGSAIAALAHCGAEIMIDR